MKLPKIVVLFYLIIFSLSLSAMDAIPQRVIPPENIVRLVFMGKTGNGKSTTINAFFNFAKDVKSNTFPKLFPIKTPHQPCNVPEYYGRNAEDHTNGQLDAVTQEPSEYEASGENLIVNLVDCPGVADPRGVEKDVEITKAIAEFLNRAGEFNALCIVMPNTVSRATIEEKYLVEQIKTIIPKSSQDRIFLVITHTTRPSHNVLDFAEYVGLPTSNVFAFDHLSLSREGHISPGYDEGLDAEIEVKWGISKKSFEKLITKAKDLGKYSTAPMARISEIKRLTAEKIYAALRQVDTIEITQEKMENARASYELAQREHGFAMNGEQAAAQAMQKAKAEKDISDALNAYENYEVMETYNTYPKHNTNCIHCYVTCHESCGLDYKGENETGHLSGCSCIINGYCTQCSNKCHYTDHRHRHEAYRTVTQSRELQSVRSRQTNAANTYGVMSSEYDSKKRDLEAKASDKQEKRNLLDEINSCLANLKREKDALQEQIVALYLELDAVSMGSISFHIGEYYDKRISNTADPAQRRKLEKDRRFYTEQVDLYKRRVGQL